MDLFSKKTFTFILFLLFSFTQTSSGAMLLMVRDTLSNSVPGAWVNHTVEFKTNTYVPSGGQMEFETEPGYFYIPSSFNYEDMDLLVRLPGDDDYQYRGLGPIVSGTTSAVSVGSGSFGSVVITLAEDLPAGSEVKIRMGTHAEYGVGGSNSIRNPSVARSYNFFLETRDQFGNRIDNAKGMLAIVEPVTVIHAFDLDLPERFNGLPEGELPGETDQVTISLNTDIFAICRYSEESGVEYGDMPYSFSARHRMLHSRVITVESEQEYSFYVRCENVMGEHNFDDYEISFSVAPAPSDGAVPGDPDDDEVVDGGGTGGSPGGGGGGGGGGTGDIQGDGDGSEYPPHTGRVIFEGWSYPNSNLTILKDGLVVFDSTVSEARFSRTVGDIDYGGYTFTVYANDPSGVQSASKHSTLTVRSNTTNRISNIFLPPTVSPKGASVDPGGTIDFSGYSFPDSNLQYEVLRDGTAVTSGSTQPRSNGSWVVTVDTSGLSNGTYTFQVRTALSDGSRRSDWEGTVFGVGVDPEEPGLSADLNKDGRVNLADFSILLFHWGTSNPIADINNDGRVGLADFSIMLFQWTG